MKNLNLLAAIFVSLSLTACGPAVGTTWCERKASCAEELGETTTETVEECKAAYDESVLGFTPDQLAITEAFLNTCLAKPECTDFSECMDSLQ